MKKQISPKIVSLTFGVLVVCFAMAFYVLGWTEPTQTPPEGDVLAPLNVGPTGQSKAGGLILNTGGAVNGLIVDKGSVGIGTTNPSQKLDVAGQIHATGDICTDQGGGVCLSTGGGGLICIYISRVGNGQVDCPSGYTMTGCGFEGDYSDEIGYCHPNGNGCACYEHIRNCYARCCKID